MVTEKDIFGIDKQTWDDFFSIPDSSSKKEITRDSKRAFSGSQKKEILFQQDMKCAVCHEKLDPRDIEFDHKKPWAANGRTITRNGRAVCGSCHNIITHKQRLKKSETQKDKEPRRVDVFGLPI